MPTYVFHCPEHGDVEQRFSFNDEVPVYIICPKKVVDQITCGIVAKKIVTKPAAAIVVGGTGGGRLS